jgi:hypothetical protein
VVACRLCQGVRSINRSPTRATVISSLRAQLLLHPFRLNMERDNFRREAKRCDRLVVPMIVVQAFVLFARTLLSCRFVRMQFAPTASCFLEVGRSDCAQMSPPKMMRAVIDRIKLGGACRRRLSKRGLTSNLSSVAGILRPGRWRERVAGRSAALPGRECAGRANILARRTSP